MLIKILRELRRSMATLSLSWLAFLSIVPILANASELQVARQCMAHILRFEQHHQIPSGLLFAIAKTESGKKISAARDTVPWPWAINVQGKSMFFHTKEQAVVAVNGFLKKGIRNIDIGCMQISYLHHGHKFKSVNRMFEPLDNVEYGARFLTDLKNEHGSWTKAVGLYHSATLKYQIPYKKKVYQKWKQHLGRNHPLELYDLALNIHTHGSQKRAKHYHPYSYYKNHPLFFMRQTPAKSVIRTYHPPNKKQMHKIVQHSSSTSKKINATSPRFFQKVER